MGSQWMNGWIAASVAAAGVGSWLAWHASGNLVAVSVLFPSLAMTQSRRAAAALVSTVCYAVASWPVVQLTGGIVPWLMATACLSLPWTILWHSDRGQLWWRLPAALLLATVPPIGIIGWASPLTSAGVLFPGSGWLGVALVVAAMVVLALRQATAVVALVVVSMYANSAYLEPKSPGWTGIDTDFGSVIEAQDPAVEFRAIQSIHAAALETPARVLVFPETVVRSWTEATEAFWEPTTRHLRANGKTILVGATVPSPTSQDEYLNVLIARGVDDSPPFQQRIPVPLAMWKPWGGKAHVPLALLEPATIDVAGERAAVLVCYEQLLPWAYLTGFFAQPTTLVGASNVHWTKHTAVPRNQHTALRSWGRLFGIPIVSATNR